MLPVSLLCWFVGGSIFHWWFRNTNQTTMKADYCHVGSFHFHRSWGRGYLAFR
jgi:hypothetical protein